MRGGEPHRWHLASLQCGPTGNRYRIMICVSLGRTRHKMMVAEHKALAGRGAELVELRLDWLSHLPDLGRLLADRPTPGVVTCRRGGDKGPWRGWEGEGGWVGGAGGGAGA